jgi:hypothetical protein
METMTFKCSEKLAKWLQGESKLRKIPKSDLIRQALEFFLLQKGSMRQASLYSMSKDLCGSLQGPEDLSENPTYLEGYGQ